MSDLQTLFLRGLELRLFGVHLLAQGLSLGNLILDFGLLDGELGLQSLV